MITALMGLSLMLAAMLAVIIKQRREITRLRLAVMAVLVSKHLGLEEGVGSVQHSAEYWRALLSGDVAGHA